MRLFQSVMPLVSIVCATWLCAATSLAEAPREIDESNIQTAGIRKVVGEHLILYTDVPSSREVDRLPAVFDKAVPQWAAYFHIDEGKTAKWQARGFLIADGRRFRALGLLPAGREDFENGISSGDDIWLRDQPSDYYRRHLLLHEGTHAFMTTFLGGCGAGWYMEGTAELLGTHQFDPQTGSLTLGIMPKRREDVPMLGRIKLIRDAVSEHRTLSLPAVRQLDNSKQLGSAAYAWCWAAAKFLDASPRYRDRFRELQSVVKDKRFNETFRQKIGPDWSRLNAEWRAYIAVLDYGYDFDRMAVDFNPHAESGGGKEGLIQIAADRGWQSSGIRLEAGKGYRLIATGRYQIAAERKPDGTTHPWPCEPNGITIEYNDGRPLGMLLGAIDSDKDDASMLQGSFANPFSIGSQTVLKPRQSGTLFLRVNDSAAHLDDNQGNIRVTLTPAG